MYVSRGTSTPRAAASGYHVTNKNIIEVASKLQPMKEQWDTPLVEYYNQKQIYRWVRPHLRLPLVQRLVYIHWEIHEACERRISMNSRYYNITEEFGAPRSTICITLNVILPPLKFPSLKYLRELRLVGKITKTTVREVITHTLFKNRPGPRTYIFKE